MLVFFKIFRATEAIGHLPVRWGKKILYLVLIAFNSNYKRTLSGYCKACVFEQPVYAENDVLAMKAKYRSVILEGKFSIVSVV